MQNEAEHPYQQQHYANYTSSNTDDTVSSPIVKYITSSDGQPLLTETLHVYSTTAPQTLGNVQDMPVSAANTEDPNSYSTVVQMNSGKTQRIYKCLICSKVFTHKNNFRQHYMTHTGEKPFACTVCSFRSSQKRNVKHHMISRHNIIQ